MNFNILNLFSGNGTDGHGCNYFTPPPPPPLSKVKRLPGIVLISIFGIMLATCGDDDEPDTNKKEEDKPENTAPTIADQTFSIAEDATVDVEVGTVKATDAENDDLTFSITSGNTDDAFAMNASSGLLTLAKALDFETDSTYTLKVSVSDGTDPNTADITINVTDVEESPPPGTRLPDKDINFAMENDAPTAFWSDGTTIWIAQELTTGDPDFSNHKKLYAYTLATGARDAAKEFNLESGGSPPGLWSDRTTLWEVEDGFGSQKLYAYTLVTGARNAAKEFNLDEENESPSSLWSDGTTLWVSDDEFGDAKLYAYTLATGVRDTDKEFNLAEENENPSGIWSNGTTIWVSDFAYDSDSDTYGDAKIYAYTLATGVRDAAKEFDLATDNDGPQGLWSDGTTLWVLDNGFNTTDPETTRDAKIYVYQLK